MDALHNIDIWVNKYGNTLKRNVCGGHNGAPFKDINRAVNTRNLRQCTISAAVDLVLLQITVTKSSFRVFSMALNISICINLVVFVTSRTRIIKISVCAQKIQTSRTLKQNTVFSPNFLRMLK